MVMEDEQHTVVQLVQKLPRLLFLCQVEIQIHHPMAESTPSKVNGTFKTSIIN